MQAVSVRDFTDADYQRLSELQNLWLPEPLTAEELRERDGMADPQGHLQRWMADVDGTAVGYVGISRESTEKEGYWWVSTTVDEPFRGRGLGRMLARIGLEAAQRLGATVARDYFREDQPGAVRFADALGGRRLEHLFESALDPATSDLANVRLDVAGIDFTNYADLPQDDESLRRLYELTTTIESAMPGIYKGLRRPFEAFVRECYRHPHFVAEGIVIAMDGDQWVGLSFVNVDEDKGYHRATGVLPEYQGRGLAKALKARSILWAREKGLKSLRTNNHSENPAMLHINEQLGYKARPGWYCYEWDIEATLGVLR